VVDDGVDGVDYFVDKRLCGSVVFCKGTSKAHTRGVYWKCSVNSASACRAVSAILKAVEMLSQNAIVVEGDVMLVYAEAHFSRPPTAMLPGSRLHSKFDLHPLSNFFLHTYLFGVAAIKKAVHYDTSPALHSAETRAIELSSDISPEQFLMVHLTRGTSFHQCLSLKLGFEEEFNPSAGSADYEVIQATQHNHHNLYAIIALPTVYKPCVSSIEDFNSLFFSLEAVAAEA